MAALYVIVLGFKYYCCFSRSKAVGGDPLLALLAGTDGGTVCDRSELKYYCCISRSKAVGGDPLLALLACTHLRRHCM
jgi:hypothetical protein